MFISNPLAILAKLDPILPIPMMPRVLSLISNPVSPSGLKERLRVRSTASGIRRESARRSANVCSATVFSP